MKRLGDRQGARDFFSEKQMVVLSVYRGTVEVIIIMILIILIGV